LHFRKTLATEPANSEAETNLGNVLLQSEHFEEAVRHYRNVAGREPRRAQAHYNLAVGLHRLGQLPEAIAQYKEALALDPKYPDAEEFLRQAESQNGRANEMDSHQP
jgi:tetratricopeptide (TPR) repeat protein